jgi:DNA-binding transcriptional LysR family regulator
MELRHLRCFVVLAEELHFGRAARRLAMSQPPLTVAIRQLEADVGASLFTRSSRSVALSAAGEALLPRARAVLNGAQSALQQAREVGQGRAGQLRVGMVGTLLYCGLPAVVQAFGEQHPGVHLSLHELSSARQLQGVREGELDVGLFHATRLPSDLASQRLVAQQLWACVRSDGPWAAHQQIDLADWRDETLVLVDRAVSPDYHDAVMQVFTEAMGVAPRVHGLQHWLSVVATVAQGLGVGLAPQAMAAAHLPGVVMRPLRQRLPAYDTHAVWRPGQDHAALQAFTALLPCV